MLRDTLVATAAALTVVAVSLLAHRPIEQANRDEMLHVELDHRIVGQHTVKGGLRQAVAQLAAAGATVEVHWEEGEPYVEADKPAPIDLSLRDATLEQWLQALTFQVVGRDLAYWADLDGIVQVAVPHRQRPPLATRVYDVRDVLEIERSFSAVFPRPNFVAPDEPVFFIPSNVTDWGASSIIEDLGGGYTWIIHGGGSFSGREVQIGDMTFVDGRLIISHTPEVHRRIAALLVVLRANATPRGAIEGSP